ncbi:MAG: hypothetical protein RJB66_1665 [Pseudomonadota bacterium]|jgi:poly(hydroxyalkanoate) depolymerase family esterase
MKNVILFLCLIVSPIAEARFLFHEPLSKPAGLAPLFVVLHGYSSSPEDVAEITRFSEQADKNGFYVLYPEAQDPGVWSKCWEYYLPEQQTREGVEASDIVKEIKRLVKIYPIDSRKIFLAGMSAGASMSSILASCHPEVFRGVAFHSGTSYGLSSTWEQALIDLKAGPSIRRPTNSACRPSDFKGKVLVFHGTADKLVNGRHFDRYIADFVGNKKYVELKVPATTTQLGYRQRDYQNNKAKTILVEGLIHAWSGGTLDGFDGNQQPSNRGPDATQIIIESFL